MCILPYIEARHIRHPTHIFFYFSCSNGESGSHTSAMCEGICIREVASLNKMVYHAYKGILLCTSKILFLRSLCEVAENRVAKKCRKCNLWSLESENHPAGVRIQSAENHQIILRLVIPSSSVYASTTVSPTGDVLSLAIHWYSNLVHNVRTYTSPKIKFDWETKKSTIIRIDIIFMHD